jgi:hypothetical protein
VRALDKSYTAEACVVDPGGLSACRSRNVQVTSPAPPTTTAPCPTPTANLVDADDSGCSIFAQVAASGDTIKVTACATVVTCAGLLPTSHAGAQALPVFCADATQDGDWFASIDISSHGSDCYSVNATATNNCGGSATTGSLPVNAFSCGSFFRKGEVASLLWSSDLRLEGGRLQVVVNGNASAYPERGRSLVTTRIKDGDNRVEATVVDAAGKAGSWTVDLSASQAIQPGSIRVLSGEVESIGATAVTFKLKGISGERIAFTFQKK